ncbi:DUF1573 domain-containing protein [Nonlabens sp. SY33080]|nr:DUF1573 domain-containing protein [Nonlabens sp. SY33080]PQJ19304.1 hypothetical protein BST93_05990 [Nonlabens tegetincola]
MKNLILLVAFLSFTQMGVAQKPSTLDPMTTVEFETTTIDYGEIKKDSDGVRTFKFKNTGEHPLKIYQIYSSCRCDILEQPEKPIAPGETGVIKVKYDTKKIGPIVKTLTVITNIKEKQVALRLKGRVIE